MALNKVLEGLVKEFCTTNSIDSVPIEKAYEHLVNYVLISKMHPEAFSDINDLKRVNVDDGSTLGIDGIAFIVNDNLLLNKDDLDIYVKSKYLDVKIVFIQTKTEEGYDSGQILKTIEAVHDFFGARTLLSMTETLQNAYSIYEAIMGQAKFFRKSGPEISIFYATAAKKCTDQLILNLIAGHESNFPIISKDVYSASIRLLCSEEVIESYKEVENRIDVTITFKNTLSLDKIAQVEQSYLGYLPCNEYLKIITDSQGNLRRRLFYENVRDYQGLNNSVNSEMRETLKDSNLREKFILLNNGVTIVAKHLKSLGSNTYEMRDFHIVNGCQTSNELFNAKAYSDDVLVPVKIIHTTDSDLISMIVKATNRQTPVPEEAFLALERYHKRLQDNFDIYSQEMPITLRYERRSGEISIGEAGLFAYQKVTLHSLIRAITSVYFLDPHVVYNNNPANILRNRRDKLFLNDHKPETYYLSNYLLAKFTHLQTQGVLSSSDYKVRYYVIMVVRFLLQNNMKNAELNSKEAEKTAKKLIEILKSDENRVKVVYTFAKRFVTDLMNEYIMTYNKSDVNDALRDSNFSTLIKSKLAEKLKNV